ncbi:MAG: hypothetical protein OXJ37_14600 [Bryobacterales bacterium]|nr:hypothetical protein [Bryobacterales bacterium]MDE0623123.1 hypothetical protein [Bryobacterales bacterium]
MLNTTGSAAEAGARSPVRRLVERGVCYRDLNGNGKMDPYEDPRAPVVDRVEDLLGRMSLDEKAGLMFQPPIAIGRKGAVVEGIHPLSVAPTTELIARRHLSHFNILMAPGPGSVARWHNSLQKIAERTRLGIPITLSSDPRHAAGFNPATGIKQEGFSQWPSQLGLAAAADEGLAERFGDIVRREFRAIGLRSVLGPMADVATEPRWGRSGATFGEDAELVGRLAAAFVRGLQGGPSGLHPSSVAAMVKHFPGGGPAGDGLDPHFSTGKRQLYPGNHFEYHLGPFRSAIAAGARQIMLSYGIPGGQTSEDVAMAFNSEIVTDLLRDRLGFDGVVSTDWLTVDSHRVLGILKLKDASAWGVEHLKVPERYARAIEAGVDQFGGESNAQAVAGLVRAGRIPESRIDISARRILRVKFEVGLFDDPYADADAAASSTGTAEFVQSGIEAQRRSLVLLSNNPVPAVGDRPVLPLSRPVRLYVEGVDPSVARNYGTVVSSPSIADVAVLRLASPRRFKWSKHLLEYFVPQGSLAFKPGRLARVLACCRTVPTVIDVRLDRPAIITEIASAAAAVLVSFGCNDEVLLDALFGKFSPTGMLPVDLPSSMAAVESSRTDVPRDTESPLYEVGWRLSYESGESKA